MSFSNFTLKPIPLVAELLTEMRLALEAFDAGDVDAALKILRERCHPAEPLEHLPKLHSLDAYRLMHQMAQRAPQGLLLQLDVNALEHAATKARGILSSIESDERIQNVVFALDLLADLGFHIVQESEDGRTS